MKKVGVFFKKWWLLLAIIVVIATIIVFHLLGYRIGPGVSIVRVGTLVLDGLPAGASIYVDEVYNRKTAGGEARISMLPGNHTLAVSQDGDYPWYEVVTIVSDTETLETPVFVHNKSEVRKLAGDEVAGASKLVSAAKLPTLGAPLSMEKGCANVYVAGNRIIAEAGTDCTPPPYLCSEDGTCGPTVVFAPVEPLNTLLAYPGRDDMMIVSVGHSLFVLELDPRTPQFFAPILKGDKPRAATLPDGSLIVYSGIGNLFEVKL